ncbi:MAG TPA: FAD-binding oxidoreductase [Gemmatimonadaceae bacterium]|nr:FAD-binding oxidoreductase [Gemmatimonadaceae bacterium]
MDSSTDLSPQPPRTLAGVAGTVITPEDAAYDEARAVFYGDTAKQPAMIVRVAGVEDVRRVIATARDHGYELAVRSGGHSIAGHCTTEGGIVIDLRSMSAIEIDADDRSAWVETGATAIEVTEAAAKHGLVVGFGDSGSVGVGGITLAGGIGFLVRKFGLTIDSVLAAEVVTADGRHLRVDVDHHPELFWALRGGGGNFGVVTRVRFRLHEMPQFTGGILVLPATPETIASFAAASFAAPEELSTIGNIMPAPPAPFIPANAHGRLVIVGMLAFAGNHSAAERALAPFRSLATPIADLVKEQPYAAMYPPEAPNVHPTAIGRTMFLDGFDKQHAETIFDYLSKSDAAVRVAQLRVLGGAAARVVSDATAYAHRSKAMLVNVAAFYTGPEDREVRRQWVGDFAQAVQPNDSGAYVGFLGNEGAARVRSAYPGETWRRLTQIKAMYDPENLFRLNQNIPPTGRG